MNIVKLSSCVILCLWLIAPAGLFAKPAEPKKKNKASERISQGLDLASGGLEALSFLVETLSAGIFDSNCHTYEADTEGELDDICSILADYGGLSEEIWKKSLDNKLDDIQTQVTTLGRGQSEIKTLVLQQSAAIQESLESLPFWIRVFDDLQNIETAWSHFHKEIETLDKNDLEGTKKGLKSLAKELLEDPKLAVGSSTLELSNAMEVGLQGFPPLPISLAESRLNWIDASRLPSNWDYADPEDFDIRPDFEVLAQRMSQWVLYQRQGHFLTQWARGIYKGESEDKLRKRHEEFQRSLTAGLNNFQAAVDHLVLNASFPRSPFADFLPLGAQDVYSRADAICAMNVAALHQRGSDASAIWGRVISMGDSFDGTLTLRAPGQNRLSLTSSCPEPAPRDDQKKCLVPVRKEFNGQLDWWEASDPKRPLTFDVVHFGTHWRVFRFHHPIGNGSPTGVYHFKPEDAGNALPILDDSFVVDDSLTDTEGRKIRFGSFVGIARAGGGYGLFSGDYTYYPFEEEGDAKGNIKRLEGKTFQVDWARAPMPRPVVFEHAKTTPRQEILPGRPPRYVAFSLTRTLRSHLRINKTVKPASGKPLKLTAIWNHDPLGSPPAYVWDVLRAWHNWSAIIGEANYYARVGVSLGEWINPNAGLFWRRAGKQPQSQPYEAYPDGQRWTRTIPLPASKEYPFIDVGAEFQLKTPPNAGGSLEWLMVAKASFQTVFVSE